MSFDPDRPVDPRDYTRRTLLANERTYLAWWRTGLATLTVALAAARVIPDLGHPAARWPYTALGVVFAVLGTICIGYAERRRRSVSRAVRRGDFSEPSVVLTTVLTVGGTVAGVATLVLILVDG